MDAVFVGTFVGPLHCRVPRRRHTSTPTISKWEKTVLAVHRDLQRSLRCVEAQVGGGQKPSPASLQLRVGRSRRTAGAPGQDAVRVSCAHLLTHSERVSISLFVPVKNVTLALEL